jgi:hypothetical protein
MKNPSIITRRLVALGIPEDEAAGLEAAVDDLECQPRELHRVFKHLEAPGDTLSLEAVLIDLQLHLQHTQFHTSEALAVIENALSRLANEIVPA